MDCATYFPLLLQFKVCVHWCHNVTATDVCKLSWRQDTAQGPAAKEPQPSSRPSVAAAPVSPQASGGAGGRPLPQLPLPQLPLPQLQQAAADPEDDAAAAEWPSLSAATAQADTCLCFSCLC